MLPSQIGLIGYAMCFGIGHGAMTPMRVTLVVDAFGVARYGTVAGVIKLISTLTSAFAPVAVGVAVTILGTYTPVLVVVIALSLVASGLLLH